MSVSNAPGLLVILEGIDGAGKTTVVRRLAQYCEERGIRHVCSFEPTEGQWARKIHESKTSGRLSLDEELNLFLKDREEHVRQVISPALQRGDVVILDRYFLSTAAYQGARGADPVWILEENERFAPKPDLALLLDVDPDISLGRVRARGDAPNTFEKLEQLRVVRSVFRSLQRPYIQVVDASKAPEQVVAECRQRFDELLQSR
jgi:dTMP kinase